jgi:hypothetical protein
LASLSIYTSLNPVPNAQVCGFFDGTYYKITTRNYISKTSLYTTFHMYPLGPWPLKILMFALLVTCEITTYNWPWEKTGDCKYMLGLLLILTSKSWGWGCPPPRAGHAFSRQQHMRRNGVIYFCQGFLPCMMSSMDGWRDEWMDEKLHEKRPRCPLLYVIYISFSISISFSTPPLSCILLIPSLFYFSISKVTSLAAL